MSFFSPMFAWKHRLFLVLVILVSLAVVFPAIYAVRRAKQVMIEETQAKALDIAGTISAFLTNDIERYRMLSQTADLVSGTAEYRYYEQMTSIFRSIKDSSDAAFIFTTKYIDEQTDAYVLDGEDPESDLFSPFGSIDTMNPTELYTFQTGLRAVSDLEDDPNWGAYITAYAPIKDWRDHTIVGVVGVDYSADYLQLRHQRITVILIFGFAFFIFVIALSLYTIILSIYNRANIDELTQLGNKRSFNRTLADIASEARKHRNSFSLLMLDVDQFKAINDSHGHLTGDKVLKHIAKTLQLGLAWPKGCFRYGGDEFAIILPACDLQQAYKVKQELQEEVKAINLEELEGKPLSISIGVAEGRDDIDLEELVSCADKALYEQKRTH
ncbi:MAG: GGDEF domain-containing protein [Sphaerochaeta sp.]|nr:GGDEF domain-containing protein [Sphaerochaeta sp.]